MLRADPKRRLTIEQAYNALEWVQLHFEQRCGQAEKMFNNVFDQLQDVLRAPKKFLPDFFPASADCCAIKK